MIAPAKSVPHPTRAPNAPPMPAARLGVVIINFRTPSLVVDCLNSLADQLEPNDASVVVVDNCSGDGSADEIAAFLDRREGPADAWKARVELFRSAVNGGFSAGNNLGVSRIDARGYLLLNSDTLVRTGAIAAMLAATDADPEIGALGPRLEDQDGTAQQSAFAPISPLSELLQSARYAILDRIFTSAATPPPPVAPTEPDWLSFACVLISRRAIDAAGPMDEGFFMYFEDADYCRLIRAAGFRVVHDPGPRVVHLRGGSSPVKTAMKRKKRPPAYFYASRTRYFRKAFGPLGPTLANLAWLIGRGLGELRRLAGATPPPACEKQAQDIWTNWREPLGDRLAPSAELLGEARAVPAAAPQDRASARAAE